MSRHALAAATWSLVLAGCFSPGAVYTARTDEGRLLADPGPTDAYLVWHDPSGWHLRVRSDAGRTFAGQVEADRPITVTPVGLAPEALRASGHVIAFGFVADPLGGEVGFDWQGGCSFFSLYVDGDARPLRVLAGAYGASPPRIPFSLCPYVVR
jgi:hypothetical protein